MKSKQRARERHAITAICSIYGIDLLPDNVQECRERLHKLFSEHYEGLFPGKTDSSVLEAAERILALNIAQGDALSLTRSNGEPIVFAEWSAVNGSYLKRRDFSFKGLLEHQAVSDMPLFSDLGEDVFLPTPQKEYPLTQFKEVAK